MVITDANAGEASCIWDHHLTGFLALYRELHTDLMQMLGEATSMLHVERLPVGQQGQQHQHGEVSCICDYPLTGILSLYRELHTDLMQMLGEATSMLHVERPPVGQQGHQHQHQHQHTRQEVGERLEVLCGRLQTFEDQAAVDRARNLQASATSCIQALSAPISMRCMGLVSIQHHCLHQRFQHEMPSALPGSPEPQLSPIIMLSSGVL